MDIPIVDGEGRELAADGTPLSQVPAHERKKLTPLLEPASVTVARVGKNIIIEANTVDRPLHKELRLPSLAVVDAECGRGFVRKVVSLLKIQRDGGEEELVIGKAS